LFDILPAISSGKVGDFFCLASGNPAIKKMSLQEISLKQLLTVPT